MPKIVCISDTHTMHDEIVLEPADILLHAGDITYRGEYHKLQEFDDWASVQPVKDIVVIPGNHDLTYETDWEEAEAHMPSVTVLNQQVKVVQGLAIYGEPRTTRFHDWAFNVDRNEMREVWHKVPTSIDVLLTHGPPAGVGDANLEGESCGCPYLRSWIEKHQPKLVVCGHIHEGYGTYLVGRTLVVNASICNRFYKPLNPPVVVTIV